MENIIGNKIVYNPNSIFFNTGNDDKDKSNSDAINKYSNYIRCITFKIHVTIKVQNFSISQL